MTSRFEHLPHRRAIVDRRALAETIAALPDNGLRNQAVALLKAALAAGRAEIARRLAERPTHGLEIASAQAYLIDRLGELSLDRR